ncbi:MAG TPA: spore gernimation protein GerPD [Paenibacillus sp.]|nr:spore gernimation protein GerPD [Paenibacillus sp.]HZG83959.1 spore gernimation protein GerPD [Paenibacillus sp.]
MRMTVVNRELSVGSIRVVGVASASVLLVGDARTIRNSSIFDTPPESVIVGPLQPLPPESPQEAEER